MTSTDEIKNALAARVAAPPDVPGLADRAIAGAARIRRRRAASVVVAVIAAAVVPAVLIMKTPNGGSPPAQTTTPPVQESSKAPETTKAGSVNLALKDLLVGAAPKHGLIQDHVLHRPAGNIALPKRDGMSIYAAVQADQGLLLSYRKEADGSGAGPGARVVLMRADRTSVDVAEGRNVSVVVTPDGTRAVVQTWTSDESARAKIIDVESGQVVAETPLPSNVVAKTWSRDSVVFGEVSGDYGPTVPDRWDPAKGGFVRSAPTDPVLLIGPYGQGGQVLALTGKLDGKPCLSRLDPAAGFAIKGTWCDPTMSWEHHFTIAKDGRLFRSNMTNDRQFRWEAADASSVAVDKPRFVPLAIPAAAEQGLEAVAEDGKSVLIDITDSSANLHVELVRCQTNGTTCERAPTPAGGGQVLVTLP